MTSILKSFIPHLIARCDLVEVIDARLPLKKKGKNYVACCPFHQESTPSFTVTPEKQFYYCFGCGAGGNVINFVMTHEHLSFVEAVEALASRYKLTVAYEEMKKGAIQGDNTDLYALLDKAVQFYQRQLQNSPHAQHYLEKRGLSKALIQQFAIGYAPSGWQNAYHHLHQVAHQPAVSLQSVGLIIAKENGKEYYDRFRERIMFPIRDRRGRTIGFGGRALQAQANPKYLNSPETSLFRKSDELYGLYEAMQQPSASERIWVVEGYMDVLSLVQYGIQNVVATLGTATSRSHILRLFSITQEIIFCFDGDTAGKTAAWRALETSLAIFQDGWSIRFLVLPAGEDPDSLIRRDKNSLDHEKSESLSDFFFQTLSHNIALNTSTEKAKFAKRGLAFLKKMPSSVTQQHLFEHLARLVGVELKTLSRLISEKPVATQKLLNKSSLKITYSPLDRAMVGLLRMPQWADQFNEALQSFTVEPYTQLKAFAQFIYQTPQASTGILLEYFRDQVETYERIKQLVYSEENIPITQTAQEFQEIVIHLQKMERNQRIEHLIQSAKLNLLSAEEQKQLYTLMDQMHSKK